jgi:hypothetical protein
VADYDGDGDLELPNSANFTVQLDAPAPALRGQPYLFDVSVPVATTPSYALLAVGSSGTPVVLPGLGLLRLDLVRPIDLLPLGALTGPHRLTWNVPNDPNLAGSVIAFQGLVLLPSRPAALTNAVFETIL